MCADRSSTDESLDSLQRLFPTALFDATDYGRLLGRVGALPVRVIFFGLELRLQKVKAAMDVFASIIPGRTLANRYMSEGRSAKVWSLKSAFPNYTTELCQPNSPLALQLEGVMVEYDIIKFFQSIRSVAELQD